jgi:hypothetical protein
VTERAIAEAGEVIASAEPAEGDPGEALARVLASAWRTLGPYHALVEINARSLRRACAPSTHRSSGSCVPSWSAVRPAAPSTATCRWTGC